MAVHTFLPGEHDEYVCTHILQGREVSGPVEHVEHPDGSVTVTFPDLETQDVTDAIASYSRSDYEPKVVPPSGDILLAVFASLGKPTARALAREYPDAMISIDHRNWGVLRASVEDMLEDEAISPEQYAGIQQLFTALGIPEA